MEDRTMLCTLLVTNTDDSGPGSLRQAILDSNAAVGATNTIDFDIPGPGVQTIFPLSDLPAISGPVLIDGFSQPGYAGTPLIELNGDQSSSFSYGYGYGPGTLDGLTITGSGVTVRGLDIDSFEEAGIELTGPGATGDWIYGNYLGTDPTGTLAEPNTFGVEIDGGASDNLIGTNGDGVNDAAEQNLISGNKSSAVVISGQGTDGNVVAGNLIGASITGDVALANANYSYYDAGQSIFGAVLIVGGASDNRIGTDGISVDAAGQGNVISGNGFGQTWGVQLDGSSDNVVAGNDIGTDVTGSIPLPNGAGGIGIFEGSTDNTIGGTTAVSGNLITNNGGPGVEVSGYASVGNQITANTIFANTAEAFALGDNGATVTDNLSSPSQGPNDFQNDPVIVTTAGGQLQGALWGSLPDTTFRVDLFAGAAYNASGSGEAQDYLGSLEVTTNGQGQAVFDVPYTPPAGLPIVTATATDPSGNTSEVSALRQATLEAPSPSIRDVANQPLAFMTESGDGIAIEDPDAGPLDPDWSVTLSVSEGTLILSSTDGLTGSGDGTGSLSYSGPLSALDGALNGLRYTPPAGPQVLATLTLAAQCDLRGRHRLGRRRIGRLDRGRRFRQRARGPGGPRQQPRYRIGVDRER
jgi:hypothetical protein